MRRKTYMLALLSALSLLASSCANSKDTGFPPPPTEEPSESASAQPSGPVDLTGPIDVGDNFFKPQAAKVKVGTEVLWLQTGSAPHTVTFDDGSFDSHKNCNTSKPETCMAKGDRVTFSFTKVGDYPYYCRIHGAAGGGFMAGSVTVEA